MNKFATLFSVLFGLVALAQCQSYVRFLNALEGDQLTIYTTEVGTVHLAYQQITDYIEVASGSVSVSNVVNSTGFSLTNAEPLLLQFSSYATFVLIAEGANSSFFIVYMNDTTPAITAGANALVRLVDLSAIFNYITLASASGSIASYVGYLESSAYTSVPTSVTALYAYDSVHGNFNQPLLTVPVTLNAGELYSAYFFTASEEGPAIVFARTSFGASTSTSSTSSSSSSSSSSTSSSSSSSSSSSGIVTPKTTSSTSGETQTGSASQLASFGIALLVGISMLL